MAEQITAIAENLERVRERIARAAERAARRADDITLVAISKTFPAEVVQIAYQAGIRHFGENRVQEWEAKQPRLATRDATFHLVGHLQSNKVRKAARLFHRVDSLDSVELARKLNAAAADEARRLPVLLEVQLGGEDSKTGVAEKDLPALAEAAAALAHLELQGMMTIPPFFDAPEDARPFFRRLRELRDAVSARLGKPLPALSMGMSHDFEVAIGEGATEVRLGTAIFGERGQV
jgi:PLP dependent protein